MRGTRLGWLSWQSNCNSFLNTSKHDLGLKLKRFIATFMVRSSIHIRPLYSLPKPPPTISKSLSKLLVALLISASENQRHGSSGRLFALFPDLNNFEIDCETASIDDERMTRFNGIGKWRLAQALTRMIKFFFYSFLFFEG